MSEQLVKLIADMEEEQALALVKQLLRSGRGPCRHSGRLPRGDDRRRPTL